MKNFLILYLFSRIKNTIFAFLLRFKKYLYFLTKMHKFYFRLFINFIIRILFLINSFVRSNNKNIENIDCIISLKCVLIYFMRNKIYMKKIKNELIKIIKY